MTKNTYVTPGSHNSNIPTRKEFHREFTGVLTVNDFCTDYPSGRKMQHTQVELQNLRKCYGVPKKKYYNNLINSYLRNKKDNENEIQDN